MSTITKTSEKRRERTVPLRIDQRASAEAGSRKLRGYAAVFESASVPELGFREVLQPGCFRTALASPTTDVLLYWSHDRKQPLARQSAGSLRVWEDERGLAFEATLPDTQLGRDAMTLVRERIVKQMSFGFRYSGTEREEFRDGELWVYVSDVEKLTEISLVTEPAYEATSVEARATAARRGRLKIRERSPYGPDSEFSWFRDVYDVTSTLKQAHSEARAGLWRTSPDLTINDVLAHKGAFQRAPGLRGQGDARESLRRLAVVSLQRDVAGAAVSGIVSDLGVPEFILATYREAVHATGAVAAAISHDVLPQGFILPGVYQSGRLTTAASVDVQATENTGVSETSPDDTATTVQTATLSGQIDVSRQAFERGIAIDVMLARELGAAFGERRDLQLLNGAGSGGEMLGLLNVSGVTSTVYTDASPTGAEALAKIWQCSSDTATAIKYGPTALCILHPRRHAWLQSQSLTAAAPFVLDLPGHVVEAGAMPTTLGGGTEDRIIVIASPSEVVLLDRPLQFQVFEEAVNAPATLRASVLTFAALVVRDPKAIGIVSGTGLAGVSF